MNHDAPLWQPGPQRLAAANITRFVEFVRETYGVAANDYEFLWRWSVDSPENFWSAVWDFCGIFPGRVCRVFEANRIPVKDPVRLEDSANPTVAGSRVLFDGDRMPGTRWFSDARLNYAENLFRPRVAGSGGLAQGPASEEPPGLPVGQTRPPGIDDSPAIIFWNERGRQQELTFRELSDQTAQWVQTFRAWGIQPGDRIAALLPNIPQAIVIFLAAASIGATFSSCSPDFGVPGIVDRFGQITPRVLFVADGYLYGGKTFSTIEKGETLVAQIPSIERVVLVPYLNADAEPPAWGNWITWQDTLSTAETEIEFAQLPFDHPLAILYSSGTTGVPKCIVHGAGGTLLQHLKEHVLHTDLKPGDRLFYFTTTGWMMWNWQVTALASGCTLVLFDGSPFHPNEHMLWDMADAERITAFGTSAKYLSALEKAGARPRQTHRLESLRTILSTGSPLLPESFDYVYRDIKADVCLSSISGGTDIVSCFALGNPALPVYRGELQCRGLGMSVEVFNERGESVVGCMGELVCTKPFPSMPVGFWNDPDGRRYRAAYFERFPDVWHHGDWAELTPRGGVIITGRSDAVLNPGGVRIGTAEIYRQVEQIPEVLESLAVGQQWQGDVRIVLFVRLRESISLTDDLRTRIVKQLRTGASPRHVPAKILAVTDIPRTRSGKIVELAVTKVIHNRPVQNLAALANPEALDQYRDRPELREPSSS